MKPLKGSRFSINIGKSYGKEAKIINWIKQIAEQNVYNNVIPYMFKIKERYAYTDGCVPPLWYRHVYVHRKLLKEYVNRVASGE